jgi:K+-transporting ATPase ATPase C chain
LTLFALLTLLTGVVYPVLVTLIAQGAFPRAANGSLLVRDGKIRGSELIGQAFVDPQYDPKLRAETGADRYFWGRPSATEKAPYNAASSSGSNLGPTNPDLRKGVKERVDAIRKAHPEHTGPVPVDLVTASASGLDPHISPAAAEYQVIRVAKVRGMKVQDVRDLVARHTEERTFGVLGEPRVNVLLLNLALDGVGKQGK